MNIFEGIEYKRRLSMTDRLLPYGIDRTMAIVILHALNVDISISCGRRYL